MCLFKDGKYHPHNRPLIAEEDIVCYKKVFGPINGKYITPYTDTIIPTECIENKVPFKAKIVQKFRFFWNHILGMSNIVDDGFIHIYTYPAQEFRHTTFKCIIPKGTKYFIGEGVDLASKKIVFLERVNYN